MIPIVSIVGKTDSGKTTLIEKIVPELKSRGYKVGTIKHDVHGFEMDHEGKDTYRHFHAGADTVVISSSNKMAMIKRQDEQPSLDDIAKRFFQDVDIIITEGYKAFDKPKIEVFRSVVHSEPLCGEKDNRIALVSDTSLDVDIPRFGLDDIDRIVDFIREKFLSS